MSSKNKKQTGNIILNLDNYGGDIGTLKSDILAKVDRGDLKRLNELLVVENGEITSWYLRK